MVSSNYPTPTNVDMNQAYIVVTQLQEVQEKKAAELSPQSKCDSN